MNKIALLAAIALGASTTIAALAFYDHRDPLEVAFKYNNTGFRLPEFIPAEGFTIDEVRAIEKEVCGGVGREGWVPREVAFAYLDPREKVYRIPCGQGPAGYFYRSFYLSGGPKIIDEYHPNNQSLFDIRSPEQAAEYAMFFDVVLSGEESNKEFVINEDQYNEWSKQCNATSPVNKLAMAKSGQGYEVEVNYVDKVSGLFEYHHYLVDTTGTISLVGQKQLGRCTPDKT